MDNDILTLTRVMDSLVSLRASFNPTHNLHNEINEEIIKVFRKIQALSNRKTEAEVGSPKRLSEPTFKYSEPPQSL